MAAVLVEIGIDVAIVEGTDITIDVDGMKPEKLALAGNGVPVTSGAERLVSEMKDGSLLGDVIGIPERLT